MEPNLTYWPLKSFFSWFIVSKAWTSSSNFFDFFWIFISSNFFDFFSFAIKLCEERPFIGSHFEDSQVRNVLLIKKPFNHVNKNIFCRKLQGSYTFDCFVGIFRKLCWCVNYAFPRYYISIHTVFKSSSNAVYWPFAVVSFIITPRDVQRWINTWEQFKNELESELCRTIVTPSNRVLCGKCWGFSIKWLITVSTLARAAALEWS